MYYDGSLSLLKLDGKFTFDSMERIKPRIETHLKQSENKITKKHNISVDYLNTWIYYHSKDPRVVKFLNDKDDLADQMFVK